MCIFIQIRPEGAELFHADGQTDRRTDGQTDRRTDGRTDGRPDRQTAGQTDGRTDRRPDRQTDGQTDGRTDRRTDRQTVITVFRNFEGAQKRSLSVEYKKHLKRNNLFKSNYSCMLYDWKCKLSRRKNHMTKWKPLLLFSSTHSKINGRFPYELLASNNSIALHCSPLWLLLSSTVLSDRFPAGWSLEIPRLERNIPHSLAGTGKLKRFVVQTFTVDAICFIVLG